MNGEPENDQHEKGYRAAVEEIAAWMVEHRYATGHGDDVADLLRELEWQAAERAVRKLGL